MTGCVIRLSDDELARLSPYELTRYYSYLRDLAGVTQEAVFAQLGYAPEPKQWEFHRATEYDILYGGAAGGGKTKAMVMHALWAAVAYPGITIGVFRRTFPELAESVIPELARVGFGAELGFTWNGTTRELRRNGSVIRLAYLENIVDASRKQGGEYQLLLFEERTLMAPGIAEIVMERLRSGASKIPVLGVRSTSNPGGASHSEVKQRYIDPTNYGAQIATDPIGHTIRFIPAKVHDNPHVDAGYLAVLQSIPDAARRAAMLEGSWDSFAGQVFTEFRVDKHVVQPFAIPDGWSRYLGVDWGYTAPWAAIWVAEDEDGRLWVYRELYERGVGEHEQARRILAAEAGDPASYRVGDPAMGAKRGDAESITSAYLGEGVPLEPANNDRLAGWARLHSYLADGPACLHHRAHGLDVCPRLHIFAPCANLIREVAGAPYSSTKVEDVDTAASDHALDACRYALMAIGGQATFFVPHDGTDQSVALDGSPLYTPFGPYAKPPEEEPSPWFIPS